MRQTFRLGGLGKGTPRDPRRSLRAPVVSQLRVSSHSNDFFEMAQKLTYRTDNLWASQDINRTLECTPHSPTAWADVVMSRGEWSFMERGPDKIVLKGRLELRSTSRNRDQTITDLKFHATMISDGPVEGFEARIKVMPRHELSSSKEPPRDKFARRDNYWSSFILTPQSRTFVDVQLTLRPCQGTVRSSTAPRPFSPGNQGAPDKAGSPTVVPEAPSLLQLQAVKVTAVYDLYGVRGLEQRIQDVILPLSFPRPLKEHQADALWQPAKGQEDAAQYLPIRTHLLCHLDDPVSTVEAYAGHVIREGDVVVLNESALAVMQGRYRHPFNVQPTWLARLACLVFKPASSLATACGMQTLIDLVGKLRVVFALFFGTILRLLGLKGAFYMLAGEQARLIDDVSGTLTPYDKHIVLGPTRAHDVAQAIAHQFPGVGAVIVDANDLGKVDVLGASTGVNAKYVAKCLVGNPAGNSDERTPIVLLRTQRPRSQHSYSNSSAKDAGYISEGSPMARSMSYLLSPQNPFFSDPGAS